MRINGKGGENDRDVMWAEAITELFPESVYFFEHLQEEAIPEAKEHPETLRSYVESEPKNNELLEKISSSFKSSDNVDLA